MTNDRVPWFGSYDTREAASFTTFTGQILVFPHVGHWLEATASRPTVASPASP